MNCLPTACLQDLLGTGNTTIFSAGNMQRYFLGSFLSSTLIILSCWGPYWDKAHSELRDSVILKRCSSGLYAMAPLARSRHAGSNPNVLSATVKNTVKCCDNSRLKHCRNTHKYRSTLSLDSNSSPNPFFFLDVNANEARSMWKTSAHYILRCLFWKTFPFTYSKIVEAQTDGSSSRGRCVNLANVPKSKTWPLVCSKSLSVAWHQYCIYWNSLDCYRIQDNSKKIKALEDHGRLLTLCTRYSCMRPIWSCRDGGNLSKIQSV